MKELISKHESFTCIIKTNLSLWLLLLVLGWGCNPRETKQNPLIPQGLHKAELVLNDSVVLPFIFEWQDRGGEMQMVVRNADERIVVKEISFEADTLIIQMPYYLSYFKMTKSETGMKGFWYNPDRGPDYRIPVYFTFNQSQRFEKRNAPLFSINNRWKVVFHRDGRDTYGLGEFELDSGIVRGSILTESGDYRYLEGVLDGNQLKLSTFDGMFAYAFYVRIVAPGQMQGHYYSGHQFSIPWSAMRDDDFALRPADTLTKITTPENHFPFAFSDLNGDTLKHTDTRFIGKARIVQIMGSWCPNCIDESKFFKTLYEKYHSQGLEIVGLTFERSNVWAEVERPVNKMVNDIGIPYPVLFAGSHRDFSATLPFIENFVGFPTSFFIDKTGKVRRIHAGFTGPGTSAYAPYAEETERFIQDLLAE